MEQRVKNRLQQEWIRPAGWSTRRRLATRSYRLLIAIVTLEAKLTLLR